MKKEFILDPAWITQGNYLDSEYFSYILLDASLKYKKEIEELNIDRFYEVMFHILNLNNLAVNGKLLTAKFKEMWKEERIRQIREDLKKIYDVSEETAEIFKNANYVFLNLLVEYMKIHMDILELVQIIYVNPRIHQEKEIYIVVNRLGSREYQVWKICQDNKRNFGYSFGRIKSVKIDGFKENAFTEKLEKLNLQKLENLDSMKNVIYVVSEEDLDQRLIAKTIKDTVLLNKGIAKGIEFEPLIIPELYQHVWFEKIIPFTLDQWNFEKC